jgi:hypothetical protein
MVPSNPKKGFSFKDKKKGAWFVFHAPCGGLGKLSPRAYFPVIVWSIQIPGKMPDDPSLRPPWDMHGSSPPRLRGA